MAIAISLFSFLAVASVIMLFGYRRYVLAGRVYENVNSQADYKPWAERPPDKGFSSVLRIAENLAGKVPPSAAVASTLRLKLLSAGYRDQNAVAILYGLKLLVMIGTTAMMLAMEMRSSGAPIMRVMGIAVGILAGFRLPDYFLARRIGRRKKQLRQGLPDALDLMVVCAEAGLTIDRSFTNVSRQLALLHPTLCDEFSLFTAEISAGLRRREALENLAARTQEPEIRKLVAVLAQADRFGTSMADALRTHAEYLRVRRCLDTEEKASKVGVKLIFPIFFFIMPCMMLVTLGPAAITIVKHLGQIFESGQ